MTSSDLPLHPLRLVPGHVDGAMTHGQHAQPLLSQRRQGLKEVCGDYKRRERQGHREGEAVSQGGREHDNSSRVTNT